eukprot:CAMPEP_0171141120 /NCGR_PEP_ID=MMETSP0766_2-20121228/140094_1 /TAXON_ID=439317 /ORGANISM="Gambierdiscus australes, Strain CAWD 149" /LENGTH=58 /DNA_ID=CAMNT_0011604841 /DNA_START=140 /DNA_END=313 /DNA_ORIENTATION=-
MARFGIGTTQGGCDATPVRIFGQNWNTLESSLSSPKEVAKVLKGLAHRGSARMCLKVL